MMIPPRKFARTSRPARPRTMPLAPETARSARTSTPTVESASTMAPSETQIDAALASVLARAKRIDSAREP
eukprot:511263-Pleurochrysis_carterae.AAC.1